MRKFTILLASLFIGMAAFAVDAPVITKMYEFSVQGGNVPAWMDGISERNMAFYNGKIYIPSVSNGNQIYVINPATGLQIPEETITLPTRQGTGTPTDSIYGGDVAVCGIQITPTGKILVANIAADTKSKNFKVYALTPKSGAAGYDITTIIDWTNNTSETAVLRAGDHFAIYGDLTAGSNGYIMTANTNDLSVYRWDIAKGVVAANPVIFKLLDQYPAQTVAANKKIHYCPVIYPVDATHFILNSARMHPTLYDMNGAIVNTFNGTAQPAMVGISGVTHFNFKGRSFIVCGSTSHQTTNNPVPVKFNTFQAFEIMGTEFNFTGAVSLGQLPTDGFGGTASVNPNSTYNMPIVYNILENEVQFFVMVPYVAFAGYKLTIGAPTAVENPRAGSIVVYQAPAADVIQISAEMKNIELYNLTGQLVRKAFNDNKIDVKGLKGSFIIKAFDANGQLINRKVMVK